MADDDDFKGHTPGPWEWRIAKLEAHVERLREALVEVVTPCALWPTYESADPIRCTVHGERVSEESPCTHEEARRALDATPAQSLDEHDRRVREEAVRECLEALDDLRKNAKAASAPFLTLDALRAAFLAVEGLMHGDAIADLGEGLRRATRGATLTLDAVRANERTDREEATPEALLAQGLCVVDVIPKSTAGESAPTPPASTDHDRGEE